MRDAGMQVWVLTGDKLETAENIARSCGLFSEYTPILRINTLEDIMDSEAKDYSLVLAPEAVKLVQDGNEVILRILEK